MYDHEAEFSGEGYKGILKRVCGLWLCRDIECAMAWIEGRIGAYGCLKGIREGRHEERVANDPFALLCVIPPLLPQLVRRSCARKVVEQLKISFILVPTPQPSNIDFPRLRV